MANVITNLLCQFLAGAWEFIRFHSLPVYFAAIFLPLIEQFKRQGIVCIVGIYRLNVWVGFKVCNAISRNESFEREWLLGCTTI